MPKVKTASQVARMGGLATLKNKGRTHFKLLAKKKWAKYRKLNGIVLAKNNTTIDGVSLKKGQKILIKNLN